MKKYVILAVLILLAGIAAAVMLPRPPAQGPVILAAASLQEAMTETGAVWAQQGHAPPVLSFAASSALARQIAEGAPADIFVSADPPWMDYLAKKSRIVPESRRDMLSNRLVLIAPKDARPETLSITPGFALAQAMGNGRLSMADPDSVPAGRYAKAALSHLRVWPTIANRIARADNVRAALIVVERGESPYGIVYVTDARASDKVRIVGLFPSDSHPPIRYPIARVHGSSHPDTDGFLRFLQSEEGKAIFARHGFLTL